MKPRRLILAGGTVAWAAIGATRRYRRPSRDRPPTHAGRAAVVAIPLIGGLVLGIDMPDLPSIFLKFWNIGNLIWDQISNIVLSILQEAWKLLNEAIDAAFNIVNQTIEAIVGSIAYYVDKVESVTRAVGGVLDQTYDMLAQTFANFRDQLKATLEGIYGPIYEWISSHINDWIGAVVGDVFDLAKMLFDLGTDGIALLINFARDPIGFIWDLISGLVDQAIALALEAGAFGWDAFWGLFWPLLARQLGLPEDAESMIAAAKWLWTIALFVIKGDWENAGKTFLTGSAAYFEDKIPQVVHQYSDLLVALLYEAMGIEYPETDLARKLKQV